jgi:hypothetical protein
MFRFSLDNRLGTPSQTVLTAAPCVLASNAQDGFGLRVTMTGERETLALWRDRAPEDTTLLIDRIERRIADLAEIAVAAELATMGETGVGFAAIPGAKPAAHGHKTAKRVPSAFRVQAQAGSYRPASCGSASRPRPERLSRVSRR